MNVLITGDSGFIGSNVIRLLLAALEKARGGQVCNFGASSAWWERIRTGEYLRYYERQYGGGA